MLVSLGIHMSVDSYFFSRHFEDVILFFLPSSLLWTVICLSLVCRSIINFRTSYLPAPQTDYKCPAQVARDTYVIRLGSACHRFPFLRSLDSDLGTFKCSSEISLKPLLVMPYWHPKKALGAGPHAQPSTCLVEPQPWFSSHVTPPWHVILSL